MLAFLKYITAISSCHEMFNKTKNEKNLTLDAYFRIFPNKL